ncbi:hypothetical protein VHA01S_008_00735 [Vibrio halioticoli NBRC 102217]|uniref:Uncharacterized protein n=1 Tax=Vibrio halioticoli NBRC 102217 TaxID=1219072 RepID=V5FBK0_9VIBR|nr:hypothetical protein VHA01S_008_00735 [Vibrio halioticoli NBRC 102217]
MDTRGGPQVLTTTQIAHIAFDSQHKKPKIVRCLDGLRHRALRIVKCLRKRWGSAAEIFLTIMGDDAIAVL